MEIRHGLISADSHVVTDRNAFLDRMSEAKRGARIPQVVEVDDNGQSVHRWGVNGRPLKSRGVCNCPAVMGDPLRNKYPQRWEEVPAEAYIAAERLSALDADGIDVPQRPGATANSLQQRSQAAQNSIVHEGERIMDALDNFNRELADKHLLGFWNAGNIAETYEPRASYEPCLWRWQDVHTGLMKAGELLTLEQTARRFIGFHTPNKFRTTHTLAMGVQLVKPGEVAEAHRHTMGAIRFVIQGVGAQTTVNGEAFPMEKGDLVTTPNRAWHDHFNGSPEPIIWIDGTDLPMVKFFEISFGDLYPTPQQGVSKPRDYALHELGPARPAWVATNSVQPPPYRYRWKDTEKALMTLGEQPGDPHDGIVLRYINPVTGGPTLPTLSCEIHMLRPGEETKSHRHTSSMIYHVFKGSGVTTIGEQRFEWHQGDSFTIPQWQWHRHANRAKESAILFVMNDKPVLEALGFYKEESGMT